MSSTGSESQGSRSSYSGGSSVVSDNSDAGALATLADRLERLNPAAQHIAAALFWCAYIASTPSMQQLKVLISSMQGARHKCARSVGPEQGHLGCSKQAVYTRTVYAVVPCIAKKMRLCLC